MREFGFGCQMSEAAFCKSGPGVGAGLGLQVRIWKTRRAVAGLGLGFGLGVASYIHGGIWGFGHGMGRQKPLLWTNVNQR